MKPDLTDTRVIAWGHEEPILYAGPDPDHGFERMTFSFGGETTLQCDADRVAPANTPLADAKDPRIHVEKRSLREARAAGHYGRGSWLLTLPGYPRGMWANTKGDAIRDGQRRLAILDWHASMAHLEDDVQPTPAEVTAAIEYGMNLTHPRTEDPSNVDLKRRIDAVRRQLPEAAALGIAERSRRGVELNAELQKINRLLKDRDPGDPKTIDLFVAYRQVHVQLMDDVLGMSV